MGESESGSASNGLFSALRNIAATLLASGKTRLELLSNEIEAEKLRAVELLFAVLAIAFCFGVGLILAVILLAMSFWEQRLAVLTVCALVFLVLGGVLLARLRRESRRSERIFAASVTELEQDLRQLSETASHEPPAR
jgi:uncharacterized membrane protein YqjE